MFICNLNPKFQELKDAHLTEHKRLMDMLDEERGKILIEKAKLETMERLKTTSMPAVKQQTELDAAIQIAQVVNCQLQPVQILFSIFYLQKKILLISTKKDAAKSADIERGKFMEQQRQFELKKREVLEKENQLQAQQNELDLRISQAMEQKVTGKTLQMRRICGDTEQSTQE